ncbi:probable E3 ubiquitin-protein ligase sinah [Cryptotermes secundus]|nr:probable E3 ubiquitin-protein ligase sinah [Cryptotermes secundus]
MNFFRRLLARNKRKNMQTEVMSVNNLKCHKCPDGYVYPPIHRCKKGHLICPDCLEQEHCPICFNKFKIIPLGLEEKGSVLQFCPNSVRGCKKRMLPDDMKVHKKHCDFKELVCASVIGPEGCLWACTRKDLTEHMFAEHRALISEDFKYDFVIRNYSEVTKFHATILMAVYSHLFLAKLEYDCVDGVFFGGVKFVSGAPDIGSTFRYEFEVGKETSNRTAHYKFMFSRQLHAISEEYKNHFASDHFWFSKALGNFFTDSKDTLTVTLVLKTVHSLAVKDVNAPEAYGFVPSQYCQRCVSQFNPTLLT